MDIARFLADLEHLVAVESPSSDLEACLRAAGEVEEWVHHRLGARPERIDVDGRRHLRWRWGAGSEVLLLGHYDTVWPLGTTARWPFKVSGDTATGPGTFDMKAGLVIGVHALAALPTLDGVTLLLTGDEEIGSPTSRELVGHTARGLTACLVLEPSAPGGRLKIARKGVSTYRLVVEGRAAHAGLEPERGVNALVELAAQLSAAVTAADADAGTTVTPTTATAGTSMNTVPARAEATIDVRAATAAEQDRVDELLRDRAPLLGDAVLRWEGGINRPPLEATASAELLRLAGDVASELGLEEPRGVAVGGGSDGNFTAAVGTPTLDGLGAVGAGAHAEGEHVLLPAVPARVRLVAGLVERLRSGRDTGGP